LRKHQQKEDARKALKATHTHTHTQELNDDLISRGFDESNNGETCAFVSSVSLRLSLLPFANLMKFNIFAFFMQI